MVFDWTISLGSILTVAGFGFSGIIFVMMMRGDLLALSVRIKAVEDALKDVTKTQLVLAETVGMIKSMDERINMVSHRLDSYMNKHN